MAIEFNKASTYYKGKGAHAGEGSKHAGDADELLRCMEANHVKLKHCDADLVDPQCGEKILGALKGRSKFRNNYGSE